MYRTKLALFLVICLSVLLVAAAALYRAAERIDYNIERRQLAKEEYEAYLVLFLEAHRHFKDQANALVTGDAEDSARAQSSKARLDRSLEQLGELTKAENLFVEDQEDREEELEEFARLDRLEEEVNAVLRGFDDVKANMAEGDRAALWPRLSRLMHDGLDEGIGPLIADALEDEAGAAIRATHQVQDFLQGFRLFAQVIAPIGFVVFAFAGVVFVLRLKKPVDALVAGTRTVAAGDLGHRIAIEGRDEFAQMAQSFNAMTTELERREAELTAAKEELESKVRERTKELTKTAETLAQTIQTRQRLFADISHELRTPLTVIRGEAEVALRGATKAPEEYIRSLQRIVEESSQLTRLVDDLLLMARSETGQARWTFTTVALPELLSLLCEDVRPLAEQQDVQVSVVHSVDAVVSGDRDRLRQVFLIILNNAINYSSKGGTVDVAVERNGADVTVRVSDHGPGIPASEIDSVFERFFRGEAARNLYPAGSGLGLPLARSLVKAHSGDIVLESEVGEGTVVTVTLPLADKTGPAA